VRAGLGESASRAELERIDTFLRNSRAGQRLSLAARHLLYRDRARVWLGPEGGPAFPAPVTRRLRIGESLEFPERRIRLSWHDSPPSPSAPSPLCLPVPGAVECYTVRSACDADRVHTRGRERRLKDVLADARWSKLERARALVIEREGEILWIPGLIPMAPAHGDGARASEIRAQRLSSPN